MFEEYRISDEGKIVIEDKIEMAIERLREFEPPEGYALAFSGGKDSMVILDLAKRAGINYRPHYNLTTVDPPELVQFIKKQYPEVKFNKPKMSMWQLILHKGFPPTRVVRYCCHILKEGGGKGYNTITGVRWAESKKRSKRRTVETCLNKNMITVNPILDWSDEDVWQYIHSRELPYCSLYDEGFKRLGCIMCPMTSKIGMLRDAERWPKYYNAYLRTFNKMIENGGGTYERWTHGQDVMIWWIYNPETGDPDQGVLFE